MNSKKKNASIIEEFSGLTNEQAYVQIFSKRMMEPIKEYPGEFFGTDQRKDMQPYIFDLVKKLPKKAQIFDVGAGAGDVVDFALKFALGEITINIEEPSHSLVEAYKFKLKNYSNLKLGTVYEGPIQDYYLGNKIGIYPKEPQDLILAIHMIYHLTDFTKDHIEPEKDLVDAIAFLYSRLKEKGKIFIVYADLLSENGIEAVCGMAEKYFRLKYVNEPFADNLIAIYKARNNLLGSSGSICSYLKMLFPNSHSKLESIRKNSHFFGRTINDLGVLGLATELCSSDESPFDISKLEFCLDYISNNPNKVNLQKEIRNIPQKGFWRANEPQVIAIITKEIE